MHELSNFKVGQTSRYNNVLCEISLRNYSTVNKPIYRVTSIRNINSKYCISNNS